jgi:hypothetical protein
VNSVLESASSLEFFSLLNLCLIIKQGTVASDKNEILFSQYGINYNSEPEMFKKGSVVFREVIDTNIYILNVIYQKSCIVLM